MLKYIIAMIASYGPIAPAAAAEPASATLVSRAVVNGATVQRAVEKIHSAVASLAAIEDVEYFLWELAFDRDVHQAMAIVIGLADLDFEEELANMTRAVFDASLGPTEMPYGEALWRWISIASASIAPGDLEVLQKLDLPTLIGGAVDRMAEVCQNVTTPYGDRKLFTGFLRIQAALALISFGNVTNPEHIAALNAQMHKALDDVELGQRLVESSNRPDRVAAERLTQHIASRNADADQNGRPVPLFADA